MSKSKNMALKVFFGLIAFAALGLAFSAWGTNRAVFYQVCRLVTENHFEISERLDIWGKQCRYLANKTSPWLKKEELVERIRKHLLVLGTSHLDIYAPVDEKRTWFGQDRENGMRFWAIDGWFVVSRILEGSPAEKSGVQAGDVLERINGEVPRSIYDTERAEGEFEFSRRGKPFKFKIPIVELKIDEFPSFVRISKRDGILKISSFRQEYFAHEDWQELSNEFAKVPNLIIDLRGNLGGNFAAMLRGLSNFFCKPTLIGRLAQPRRPKSSVGRFHDTLDEAEHLELIETHHEVRLETFQVEPCHSGRVVVLTDSDTASVAEIFASAFQNRPNSEVVGQVSAGDVVLAVWYGLSEMGPGYSISVPQAVFEKEDETRLEGKGVIPDHIMNYRMEDAVEGRDTLIQFARGHKQKDHRHEEILEE